MLGWEAGCVPNGAACRRGDSDRSGLDGGWHECELSWRFDWDIRDWGHGFDSGLGTPPCPPRRRGGSGAPTGQGGDSRI